MSHVSPNSHTDGHTHKEKNYKINLLDDYRCRNYQQNTCEPNQKDHSLLPSWLYFRDTGMVQNALIDIVNASLWNINYVIITIDSFRRDFCHNAISPHDKSPKDTDLRNISQHNKGYIQS